MYYNLSVDLKKNKQGKYLVGMSKRLEGVLTIFSPTTIGSLFIFAQHRNID
jgi:hypothetical protein